MSRPEKLALAEALARAPGWSAAPGREAIRRAFRFESFEAAFAWMTRIAQEAERLDHHPEWLNVYNRVEVTLATHDAGGVTELDLRLAALMDAAFAAA
jgi:4a-hydroxytetrahydrobiopterin dehydratase